MKVSELIKLLKNYGDYDIIYGDNWYYLSVLTKDNIIISNTNKSIIIDTNEQNKRN